MTDSLSPEQVEFSWLLHLLRWEAVQAVASPPQVGSSADCHLFKRMEELSFTCPCAWDFRVGTGGGGTRGRDTFSSFIVWIQGVCQRLILSSSLLKPDSMVRLWKIIAKIFLKERELSMILSSLMSRGQLWRRERSVWRPCMDSFLYLPLSIDGQQSQHEPSDLLFLYTWRNQSILTESVHLSSDANKIQSKCTNL